MFGITGSGRVQPHEIHEHVPLYVQQRRLNARPANIDRKDFFAGIRTTHGENGKGTVSNKLAKYRGKNKPDDQPRRVGVR